MLHRISEGPGVFGNPSRSCQFLSKKLFEELNIKLRNFLHTSGKKLPSLDPKLTDGPGSSSGMMLNPVQIKRERFEEYQASQQQEQMPTTSSGSSSVATKKFPQKLHEVYGKVTHHLGQDMIIIDDLNGNWKCLAFLKNVLRSSLQITDLKKIYPLHFEVMIKASLMDPQKQIQYVANLVWNPKEFLPHQVANLHNDIIGPDITKYHQVNSTLGTVLEKVSKLPISNKVLVDSGDSFTSKPGIVDRILDENFGLLRIDKGLVLFDTCDFWLSQVKFFFLCLL